MGFRSPDPIRIVSSPSLTICAALALLSLGLFSTPAMNAQSATDLNATDLNELHNRFAESTG